MRVTQMRKYLVAALLLMMAIGTATAVAKSPPKPRSCASVIGTGRHYKATNTHTTDLSCATATRYLASWLTGGSRTFPHDAQKWHARRSGHGAWRISYGKKGDPRVTFTLAQIPT